MSAVNVHNILRKSLLSGFIAGTQPEKNNRGKGSGVGRVGRPIQNTLHIWVMFYDHSRVLKPQSIPAKLAFDLWPTQNLSSLPPSHP